MDCQQLATQLDEARTLADLDALAVAPAFQAHLTTCPACRAEFAATRCAFDHFAGVDALANALPEELVEASRQNIYAAVRDRDLARRLGHRPWLPPAWLAEHRLALAIAATAVALFAVAIVILQQAPSPTLCAVHQPAVEGAAESSPAAATVEADGADGIAAQAAADPGTGFPELDERVSRLRLESGRLDGVGLNRLLGHMQQRLAAASEEMEILAFLAALDRIGREWEGHPRAVEALRLRSLCHEALGDFPLAISWLESYAKARSGLARDAALKRGGGPAEAAAAAGTALFACYRDRVQLHFQQNDPLTALAYVDALQIRLDETGPAASEAAAFVRHAVGLHHHLNGDDLETARTLEPLFESDPTGVWTRASRGPYACALLDTGRADRAVDMWLRAAEQESDRECAANCVFNAGVAMLSVANSEAKAIGLLNRVRRDYADTGFARLADTELSRLTGRVGQNILSL